MKKYFCLAVALLIFSFSYAQSPEKPVTKAVFLELGGAGLAYTFNYDFRFDEENINSWGMRVGAGGFSLNGKTLLTAPVQVNRLFGSKQHFFEVGAGTTLIYFRNKVTHTNYYHNSQTNESYYTSVEHTQKNYSWILDSGDTPAFMGTLNFGYRKVPEDGGFLFSANLVPAFNHEGFWPLWAGLGFGYAF